MKKDTAARKLAFAASAVRWQDMGQDVQARTTTLFMDTLAVIAGGMDHPVYAKFVELSAVDSGPCSLMGRSEGVSVVTAATLHGGVTTVLQMQDGHRVARGHPASAIVPLLLALAEAEPDRYDTAAVLSAFVAGYEVGVRIGVALGGLQPEIHDVGNWATLGAAVAATHLMTAGDANAMAEAIEAAAAVALFPDSRSPVAGAGAHHLFGAVGTMTALQVARGAVAGMTGVEGSLEAFFLPRAGARPAPALLVAGMDEDGRFSQFEMLAGYLKRHPVCAHWSTTADALSGLITDHNLRADDVADVDIAVYAAAMNYNVDAPANDLAARFSGRAIAAAMLETVVLSPDAFRNERLSDSAFRARMERVRVFHDPALDAGYPAGRPVRVTVRTHDGRELSASAEQPVGDGVEGLPQPMLDQKVTALFARQYGAEGAPRVIAALAGWLAGDAIAPLTAALRG